MNRRKQTRPKRTTCSEGNFPVEDSGEKLSELGVLNVKSEAEADALERKSPLMDGDENFSEDSCGEMEEQLSREPGKPAIDSSNPVHHHDVNLTRSSSRHALEYIDQNSFPSPSGTEVDAVVTQPQKILLEECGGATEPRFEMKSESGERYEMERNLSVSDCASPASGSESEKDLILKNRFRSTVHGEPPAAVASTLLPSNPIPNGFFASEQNFVRKLESFVASMDRQTKLNLDSAICADKIITHNEYTNKTLNGMTKQDGNSKYLYYENNSRYISGSVDEPLDLSVSTKDRFNGIRKQDSYDSSMMFSSRSTEVNLGSYGSSGSSSLLASLERKFGEHSQILDRVGSLPRACHFGENPAAFGRAAGFYIPKLHDVGEQVSGCRKNFSYPSSGISSFPGLHVSDSRLRLKEKSGKDSGKTLHHVKDNISGVASSSKSGPSKDGEHVESWHQKKQKTTSLRCSCNMEFDRLFMLTVHLQETGHKPSSVRADNDSSLDNTKLVRGQDVWLHNGSEQTRQILRCMECQRSFRSLPELTVHMIQTEHYMNLIQPELTPRRISAEPGSSSGSENNDQFCCRYCSKVFEDADSLGLHIVTYGHYRRDVKQKLQAAAESSVAGEACVSSQCSFSDQNETEIASVSNRGVEIAETCKRDAIADNDEQRICPNDDHPAECLSQKQSHQTGSAAAADDNEANEIPGKIPQLDRVQDTTPASNSATSPCSGGEVTTPAGCLSSQTASQTVDLQLSEKTEIPKLELIDDSSGRSPPVPEESAFVSVEPKESAPDKESALKAMQSFINRSFGPSQENHVTRSGQQSDGNRQLQSQKSSSSSSSSSSVTPWQSASSFLTKMTWANPSPSRSRKRHHHDSDSCHGESHTVSENIDTFGKRDCRNAAAGDVRKSESRSSHRVNDSVLHGEGLWKSSSKTSDQSRYDRSKRYRDDSPCCFPSQPFGGFQSVSKLMASPLASSAAAVTSPFSETNSARKLQRSYEKDEKPSLRSEKNAGEMSTLDSLQELVYSKSFKSLEKLMHHSPPSFGQGAADRLSQSQALVISTKNSLKQAIPETLILVNPIVTVMPNNASAGGGSSLSITLPPRNSPDCEVTKDNGILSNCASVDGVDSDSEQYGEFKCLTCKRNFASKGSYRYHRSRYHAYSEIEKPKVKDPTVTNLYPHLISEQTNKFSKYYQLASELSSKSN